MNQRKPLVAGNWKMHLTVNDSIDLAQGIAKGIGDASGVDVLVAPPFTALFPVKKALGDSGMLLGAQNMHHELSGAYTGEISGRMLRDIGCTHVILGHSERRQLFEEDSDTINLKVKTAVDLGLAPIVCVGETLEERQAGDTNRILEGQLEGSLRDFKEHGFMPANTTLAYEPVWAIGTGHTATPDQAQESHQFIRSWMEEVFGDETANRSRILYGGSVKPENAADLMAQPDIDGALVGGASLKLDAFLGIIHYGGAS